MVYNSNNPLRRLPYDVYQPPQSHDIFFGGACQQGVLDMPQESIGSEDVHQLYQVPESFQVHLKMMAIPFKDKVLNRLLTLVCQRDACKSKRLLEVLPKDIVEGIEFQVLKIDVVFPEQKTPKIYGIFQGMGGHEDVQITQTQVGENMWNFRCSLNPKFDGPNTPYIPCGVRLNRDLSFKSPELVAFTLVAGLSLETQVIFKNLKDLDSLNTCIVGHDDYPRDLSNFISQGGLSCSVPLEDECVTYASSKLISQEGDTILVKMTCAL